MIEQGGALLRFDGVHAYYGKAKILDDVSLTVGEGETLALIGRNGAGKTTALASIFGIATVRQGTISVAGRPLALRRKYEAAKARRLDLTAGPPHPVQPDGRGEPPARDGRRSHRPLEPLGGLRPLPDPSPAGRDARHRAQRRTAADAGDRSGAPGQPPRAPVGRTVRRSRPGARRRVGRGARRDSLAGHGHGRRRAARQASSNASPTATPCSPAARWPPTDR